MAVCLGRVAPNADEAHAGDGRVHHELREAIDARAQELAEAARRPRRPEQQVQRASRGIRVDGDDLLAGLREVDRDVRREERAPRAATARGEGEDVGPRRRLLFDALGRGFSIEQLSLFGELGRPGGLDSLGLAGRVLRVLRFRRGVDAVGPVVGLVVVGRACHGRSFYTRGGRRAENSGSERYARRRKIETNRRLLEEAADAGADVPPGR